MKYGGKWRITEMEMWDRDYFDMEVEAYIKISPNNEARNLSNFNGFRVVCVLQ